MPAHRKPTNILELTGAFQRNPNRRRTDPPAHGPIGRAPSQKPMTVAQAWNYLVKCCPDDVLTDRDRPYLEIAASLFAEFRADPAKFHHAKLLRLERMLASLGMSPSDASRVARTPQPEANPFDE